MTRTNLDLELAVKMAKEQRDEAFKQLDSLSEDRDSLYHGREEAREWARNLLARVQNQEWLIGRLSEYLQESEAERTVLKVEVAHLRTGLDEIRNITWRQCANTLEERHDLICSIREIACALMEEGAD